MRALVSGATGFVGAAVGTLTSSRLVVTFVVGDWAEFGAADGAAT